MVGGLLVGRVWLCSLPYLNEEEEEGEEGWDAGSIRGRKRCGERSIFTAHLEKEGTLWAGIYLSKGRRL